MTPSNNYRLGDQADNATRLGVSAPIQRLFLSCLASIIAVPSLRPVWLENFPESCTESALAQSPMFYMIPPVPPRLRASSCLRFSPSSLIRPWGKGNVRFCTHVGNPVGFLGAVISGSSCASPKRLRLGGEGGLNLREHDTLSRTLAFATDPF